MKSSFTPISTGGTNQSENVTEHGELPRGVSSVQNTTLPHSSDASLQSQPAPPPSIDEMFAMLSHARTLERNSAPSSIDMHALNLPPELLDSDTRGIVCFFSNNRATVDGMYFSDVLEVSNEELEKNYYYIQCLFPSSESTVAPVVTSTTQRIFALNKPLRDAYLQGVRKMFAHWQLELCENGSVKKNSNFDPKTAPWLKSDNHNQLYMPRVLKSLCELGFDKTAKNLQALVVQTAKECGLPPLTIANWQKSLP